MHAISRRGFSTDPFSQSHRLGQWESIISSLISAGTSAGISYYNARQSAEAAKKIEHDQELIAAAQKAKADAQAKAAAQNQAAAQATANPTAPGAPGVKTSGISPTVLYVGAGVLAAGAAAFFLLK